MQPTTINLTWLCFPVLMGIVVVVAILGTRSRLRYVRRIREAQTRGVFADMNTPEYQVRFRRFALLALFGMLGTVLSFVMIFQPWIRIPASFVVIIAVLLVVFGVMGSIGGFLMKREIDRRL
jgi:hypothetical protein